MVTDTADRDTLDRLTHAMSRRLATRYPRRSFLGRVGRYATAAAVGGTASAMLWQDSAIAKLAAAPRTCTSRTCNGTNHTSPCCHDSKAACSSESVTCSCLTGSNLCPSGTCQCGCWTVCDNSRCTFPNSSMFCDCCETGSPPASSCHSGCSCTVSSCFTKEWSNPPGCGTVGTTVIRCRELFCQNHPTC